MNHTLNISSVMNPFQVLWQWLMVKPGQPLQAVGRPVAATPWVGAPDQADVFNLRSQVHLTQSASSATRSIGPVRVLQVVESGQSPSQSGRLRISGRMADVCAELDRLAAREALQH
jgi:hypothetical protein